MVTRVSSSRRAYIALGVVLLSVASVALAATFNLFSPAAGILKGNPATYVTTAATSSDVVALWSGTCNSGSVLKGDGTCAATTTGTVTSVALTTPTGLTVTGSPITTSGTLALSTTLNGPVRGNGSGLITGTTSLTTEVSGILPVANGGIGVGTLSGLAKGNGTSAFTVAASSDVIGLWTGTCNSTSFLRADGSCQSPAGGGTVTSITAGTGISASPGSPITSSGTLSVDQAFAPTWTGLHAFSPSASNVTAITITNSASSVTGLRINNNGTNNAELLINTSTAGDSYVRTTNLSGTNWAAGNRRSDNAYVIANATDLTTAKVSVTTGGVLDAAGGLKAGGVNVCLSNGTNCPSSGPVHAYAQINVVAGTSCNVTATFASANTGACTWNSTGNYTVAISGFSTKPVCMAVAESGPVIINANSTSTTSMTVHTYDAAGVSQESRFNMECIGT